MTSGVKLVMNNTSTVIMDCRGFGGSGTFSAWVLHRPLVFGLLSGLETLIWLVGFTLDSY